MKNIPKGSVYEFTNDDLQVCIKIGSERWTVNASANVRDQMYSKTRSSIDCSILGVLGEFAFLKLSDLPTDRLFDTRLCSHRDDRGDAVAYNGKKIDVKAPVGLHCHFINVRADRAVHLPDYYAFVVLERPDETDGPRVKDLVSADMRPDLVTFTCFERIVAHFRGMCRATEATQPAYMTQMSYGSFYRFPDHEMKTWDELENGSVAATPAVAQSLKRSRFASELFA